MIISHLKYLSKKFLIIFKLNHLQKYIRNLHFRLMKCWQLAKPCQWKVKNYGNQNISIIHLERIINTSKD